MAFLFDPELAESAHSGEHPPRDPVTGELLDCTRCGACCRPGRPGTLLLEPADLVRWRRQGRGDLADQTDEGHFGARALPTDEHGTCAYFTAPEGRSLCSVYPDRATVCREFRAGSWQCLEFRRTQALAAPGRTGLLPSRKRRKRPTFHGGTQGSPH